MYKTYDYQTIHTRLIEKIRPNRSIKPILQNLKIFALKWLESITKRKRPKTYPLQYFYQDKSEGFQCFKNKNCKSTNQVDFKQKKIPY